MSSHLFHPSPSSTPVLALHHRFHRSAMTLVEILAVVIILGLIAATLTIGLSGSFGKAKHELAKTAIGTICAKLETYRLEKSAWPANEVGLAALTTGQASPNDAFFLSQDKLTDPWGRTYMYLTPGPDEYPYEVLTYGADGQPGGEGENADISSANLRGKAPQTPGGGGQ